MLRDPRYRGIEEQRKGNQHRISPRFIFGNKIKQQIERQKYVDKNQICKNHNLILSPYREFLNSIPYTFVLYHKALQKTDSYNNFTFGNILRFFAQAVREVIT